MDNETLSRGSREGHAGAKERFLEWMQDPEKLQTAGELALSAAVLSTVIATAASNIPEIMHIGSYLQHMAGAIPPQSPTMPDGNPFSTIQHP